MRLIVGLGNPGKDYEYTRHNLGFLAIARIAEKYSLKLASSSRCKGLEAQGEVEGQECLLVLPLTMMNNSGVAVKQILEKTQTPLEDVLVVTDDYNLDFGQMRVRRKGSDGGHNGLSSIIYHLNAEDFCRLRIGIGPVPGGGDTVDFVLGEFSNKERKQLDGLIEEAADCCVSWLNKDLEEVMGLYNKRKENG